MLELPESIIIAGQLTQKVCGKRITEVETEHTPHGFAFYEGDPKEYAAVMEGRKITRAAGIGSMVEMELGEYSFTAGDGASLRWIGTRQEIPARYQMRITFEDDSSLIISVQMYGGMMLFKPAECENFYYHAAKEKPTPYEAAFDYAYFKGLREEADANLSMKAFLATQQRIPGLGNGVLQDILLRAGMHPKRKLKTLREEELHILYEALKETLDLMLSCGGRNTEKTLFGEQGGYSSLLSRKTLGKPCPFCQTAIEKANYLGGTIYFCPMCQK